MKKFPLSRMADIVVKELENEILIYDLIINKAFCLNKTSALVWQLCNGSNSLDQISDELEKKLDFPITDGLVWLALEQLKRESLIDYAIEMPDEIKGMSRREVLKKVGIGTAVVLPIVSYVIAPTSAAAASTTCTPGADPSGQGGLNTFCACVNSNTSAPTIMVGDTCGSGNAGFATCKAGCTCRVTAVFVNNPTATGRCV